MGRDYEAEKNKRIEFIRKIVEDSGACGIVYGNSGGKDCTLVGILCKFACDDTLGLIMPCVAKSNYTDDFRDAMNLAEQFGIDTRAIELTSADEAIKREIRKNTAITEAAAVNIAPRLRMATLYAVAATENRLVAGTGNRSENYMGYFTKWGDGAYDFNPIADLTATEVYEFLDYLGVKGRIMEKPPSGGLYDGQTDEKEMGVTYESIDVFLLTGECAPKDMETITRHHNATKHKRTPPRAYGG